MVQEGMAASGLRAKDVIEGPPRRAFPILLRQTSFLALEEAIRFVGVGGDGTHTARFGEVEQRGCALTRKGRALYDELLSKARSTAPRSAIPDQELRRVFADFPDDVKDLFNQGLAFVRFEVNAKRVAQESPPVGADARQLVAGGWLDLSPITYEDFLPVSAAGIFRSNLGSEVRASYDAAGNQRDFEGALGAPVFDEIALYEAAQASSFAACEHQIRAMSAADMA